MNRTLALLALLSLSIALPRARAAEGEDEGPGLEPKTGETVPKDAPAKSDDDGDEDDAKAAPKATLPKAELDEAKAALARYLDAVKAKKWKEARALTHPLTLKKLEQLKKRLGAERDSMAPWYWAKGDFYLKAYRVASLSAAPHGAVVAETSEDVYQVQEKGDFTGEKAAYLLGQRAGHWYVVDRKSEADGFSDDSLRYGYPGYFDEK